MIARRLFPAVATVILCLLAAGQIAQAQTEAGPNLATIMARGYLICGVSEASGFAERSEIGEWRGFDVDLCRAVAAAIFDDPAKVLYAPQGIRERVGSLQGGWIDLLASAAPWTQSRDTSQRVAYPAISLFDGQSFLVRRQRSFASAQDLSGAAICVQQDTAHELTLADFFRERQASYQPRAAATFDEAVADYESGRCDALTADASTLFAARARLPEPKDHAVLPDMLTKAPRGPVVRQGDDQWFNIVRWTIFAMINAEELKVSRANADEALKSENPEIRRLLGVDGDLGAGLGLAKSWAYRIVKHVGNYADVFEQNLGQGSPLAMERRLNALWSKGGLMYAPPVR